MNQVPKRLFLDFQHFLKYLRREELCTRKDYAFPVKKSPGILLFMAKVLSFLSKTSVQGCSLWEEKNA